VGELLAYVFSPGFWVGAGQIIGINLILSGDNAVVIALACRMLPPRQRFWGMILGAGVAVLLRVLFTLVVAEAMGYSFLKLVGGVLLLWVAVKLVVPEDGAGEGKIAASESLWRAVRIIAIADIVMSLDNVIAIAAVAETAAVRVDTAHAGTIKAILIVFGLATSIPLIIAGSAMLMALLDRYPPLVWAGAGLLGWVAGDIMIKDAALSAWFGPETLASLHHWAAAAGALFVVGAGYLIRRVRHNETLEPPMVVDPHARKSFHPDRD
jgi:YjbE family integral membrane protein